MLSTSIQLKCSTMEVLATSSLVVNAASSSSSKSSVSERKVQNPKSFSLVIPFFRPATAFAAAILASVSPPPVLAAVNYDDFVKKASENASSFPDLPSIDLPSFQLPTIELPDGASDLVSANPLVVGAGVLLALAVPFVATRAFAGTTSYGSVSAVEAYKKLADPDLSTQLLDIRGVVDKQSEGSPNLKSIRKTVIQVPFSSSDEDFVKKVLAKCKIAEDTSLYILDRFDGNASVVAKLLANSGFKSAYAIKGGAEASNGWRDKELPWTTPSTAFNFNLDGLKSIVKGGAVGVENPNLSTALGVAAAAGVGVVAFSEVESTLQLLGTVGLLQLFVKKFLFVEDRKKTFEEIRELWEKKIDLKEFGEEMKDVGRVLVPTQSEIEAAMGIGTSALEENLGVDSLTPQALGEKAKEKVVEEAEKVGVEVPDLDGVAADVKSGANELQSNVESVASDLKSGAQDLQSKTVEATSDLKSEASEVASDLESGAQDLQLKAEKTTSDLNSKASEAISDLNAEAGEVTSDVKSKAEEVTSDVKSDAQDVAAGVQSKTEEVSSDLESGVEAVGSDLKSDAEEVKSAVESTGESAKAGNGVATPVPYANVVPFFEDERGSAQAVSASGSADSSS